MEREWLGPSSYDNVSMSGKPLDLILGSHPSWSNSKSSRE